ncbi:MAG: alanyl-tRNA editing protein [Sphaerochaetaceae bacterium]|nr:alanyl-tRNA editing protein [Sphaerochaetaceae bacterium]
MVITEKVYIEKPFEKTLEATVLEVRELKGKMGALLDRTIFYPEGGGPAGDRGWIEDVRVTDTQSNREGEILHHLEKGSSLVPGSVVTIHLDWPHRYHYMIQHTGQHLISGLLYSLYGIGTLSVHLGAHDISIETDAATISQETISELIDAAREAIIADARVSDRIVENKEVADLGLRRPVKVEGNPRIVVIDGYDEIACGGIHLRTTSELQEVLFLASESIRGHVRLSFAFAQEARREIGENQEIIAELKKQLSARKEEIIRGVKELKEALNTERKRGNQLEAVLVFNELEAKSRGGAPFVIDFSHLEFDALPHAARFVEGSDSLLFCAIQQKDDAKSAYMIAIKGFDDPQEMFSRIRKEVLIPFDAKGGGKAPVFRGVLTGQEKGSFLTAMEQIVTGI